MAKNVVVSLSGGLPIYNKKIYLGKHDIVEYAIRNLKNGLLNKKQLVLETVKEYTFQS